MQDEDYNANVKEILPDKPKQKPIIKPVPAPKPPKVV